ncbi:two-component system sensor histidine kinase NtrB [Heliorestis convoluta]|uniref:histidine kinase n=1 Tax=Heliorestis convoluta TaxID=356322 RepID=A0A5Q2N6X5_9FIRM|nr:ATP-binding protein [Heliorestis convoluta]QGG48295.1 PAS domain S-box [Heliorestis convoluta]
MMNEKDTMKQIYILYELALSIGQSLDLHRNCDLFLQRFLALKNLDYAALWVKDEYIIDKKDGKAHLVYANPTCYPLHEHISYEHPLFQRLRHNSFDLVTSDEEGFQELIDERGIHKGTYILFSLDSIGVLKFYSTAVDPTLITEMERKQFEQVMQKFRISLLGCLAYNRSLVELKEREIIEAELEKRVQERTLELRRANEEMQQEVQERKKVEALLASDKSLLAVTLLSIGDAVISTDSVGRIRMINRAAKDILGQEQTVIEGKYLDEILYAETEKGQRYDPLLQYFLKGSQEYYDRPWPFILFEKDGTRRILSGSASPIQGTHGDLQGYVLVFRDITEQKRNESQLALSQKLESIGQLASGIAHEINTPMQYVGDNTSFLQEAFQDMSRLLEDMLEIIATVACRVPENGKCDSLHGKARKALQESEEIDLPYLLTEIPQAVEQSLQGIEHVSKIVLSLKRFAHPGVKKKGMADINQALAGTVEISRNEWKYVADMDLRLHPSLPHVYCAIDEINQVFLNILINATHAIGERIKKDLCQKGRITIETRQVGSNVEVLISDTGGGIDEKIVHRIFDPFFTTKDVGKGTGQGLTIAHNIVVNKHKGTISVDVTEGWGTTFIVSLPMDPEEKSIKE